MKTKHMVMCLMAFLCYVLQATATYAAPPAISQALMMSFDATDIDGSGNSTLTGGQTLTAWNDLSGYNYHLTSVDGTPIFVQSSSYYNNNPVVRFDFVGDATADFFTGDNASNVLTGFPVTIFYVCSAPDQNNNSGVGNIGSVFSFGNNATYDNYYVTGVRDQIQPGASSVTVGTFRRSSVAPGTFLADNGPSNINDGGLHVIAVRYASTTQMEFRIDMTQDLVSGATVSFPSASNRWSIGMSADVDWSQNSHEYTGDIAEVLLYQGDVTGADMQAVEEYLTIKWLGANPDGSGSVTFTPQTSGYNFPDTAVATISNDGLSTLSITALTPDTGSFPADTLTVESLLYPIDIGPGDSFQFDVNWFPDSAVGLRDAVIDVTSDNPSPFSVIVNADVAGTIDQDLVLYYDFEETAGSLLNDTSPYGNVNNGDVVGNNMSLQTTESLNTGFSRAYLSNGTISGSPTYNNANYIAIDQTPGNATRDASLPADLYFGTGDFTVSCWTNLADPPDGNNQVIWGNVDWNRTQTTGRDGVTLFRSGSAIPGVYADNAEFRWFFGNDEADTWNHWVIAGTQGAVRVYYNGEQVGNTLELLGDVGHTTTPFVLGNNAIPGGSIGGVTDCRFDEFAVWSRTLNGSEIRSIHDQGIEGLTLLNVSPQPSIEVTDDRELWYWAADQASATVIVSIGNNGQAPLIIDAGTTITGADAGQFVIDPSFDTATSHTVYPGQFGEITLEWTHGSVSGLTDAMLNFTHNDVFSGSATSYTLDLNLVKRTEQPANLLTDLVLYYEFEETSGNTVTDSSSNGNHGDVIGRDFASGASVDGAIGAAYHSPASTTDYISVDGIVNGAHDDQQPADLRFGDTATGTDFTISAWVNVPFRLSPSRGLFGSTGFSTVRDGVMMFIVDNTSAMPWFRAYDGTTTADAQPPFDQSFPLGEWALVTVTCDRDGYLTSYLDGTPIVQISTPEFLSDIGGDADAFIIGAFPAETSGAVSSPINASFDDFAVWHRALGQWEVEYIALAGHSGYGFTDTSIPLTDIQVFTDFGASDPDLPAYVTNSDPDPTTLTFTVRSAGIEPVTIQNFVLTGADADEFAIVSTTTTQVLTPGSTFDVQVVWTSDDTTTGTRDCVLSFEHDSDVDVSPYQYTLATQIADALLIMTNGPALQDIAQYSTPVAQETVYTLTAFGGSVDVASVTLSGAATFSIDTEPTSASFVIDNVTTNAYTVDVGETLDLVITWFPADTWTPGVQSATLTVTHTGENIILPRVITGEIVQGEFSPAAAAKRDVWELLQ